MKEVPASGLINSIPTNWKLAIKRTPQEKSEKENMTNIISTKNFYSVMIKNVFLPPTTESNILRHSFTRENKQFMNYPFG